MTPDESAKTILSPHDLGIVCDIPSTDVIAWIEEGKLPSFEVPGSHRRISRESFDTFLRNHGNGTKPDWGRLSEKYRVLIVEDDMDLLEIIGEIIRDDKQMDVRMEQNGFNAGLQIAGWHPDVILLDFLMPGMNGFEICGRLRENPELCDIPVLALTGLTTNENRRAVMESGVSDFLGKPFRGEQLLQKVRHLLGLRRESPDTQAA